MRLNIRISCAKTLRVSGFKTADSIAIQQGVTPLNLPDQESERFYCMSYESQEQDGHCYTPEDDIRLKAGEFSVVVR